MLPQILQDGNTNLIPYKNTDVIEIKSLGLDSQMKKLILLSKNNHEQKSDYYRENEIINGGFDSKKS